MMIYENSEGLQVQLLDKGCLVCTYREIVSRKVHKEKCVIEFEREFKRVKTKR